MRNYEFIAENVQCPFFMGSKDGSVICEGLLDGSKNTIHNFHGKEKRKEFMRKVCCNNDHWKDCALARKLWEKY